MDTIVPPAEGTNFKAALEIGSISAHNAGHIAAEGTVRVYPHHADPRFPSNPDEDYDDSELPDDLKDQYRIIIYNTAVPNGVNEYDPDEIHEWLTEHSIVRECENLTTNGDGPTDGLDIAITQYTSVDWHPKVQEEIAEQQSDPATYM